MAVPAPVITVVPNTVTRTLNNLTPSVVLTDTGTHSPVATGRTFKAGATTVGTTTGNAAGANAVTLPVDLDAGVYSMTVTTVSGGGTTTSTGVNLTVVDSIASTDFVSPERPGVQRLNPRAIPPDYQDGTHPAAGMPTAKRLKSHRDARRGRNPAGL